MKPISYINKDLQHLLDNPLRVSPKGARHGGKANSSKGRKNKGKNHILLLRQPEPGGFKSIKGASLDA